MVGCLGGSFGWLFSGNVIYSTHEKRSVDSPRKYIFSSTWGLAFNTRARSAGFLHSKTREQCDGCKGGIWDVGVVEWNGQVSKAFLGFVFFVACRNMLVGFDSPPFVVFVVVSPRQFIHPSIISMSLVLRKKYSPS